MKVATSELRLLMYSLVTQVADYGTVRLFYKPSSLRRALTKGVGSPSYRAAEVPSGNYDHKADAYSLGCAMYVCGKMQLYSNNSDTQVIEGWHLCLNYVLCVHKYLPCIHALLPVALVSNS